MFEEECLTWSGIYLTDVNEQWEKHQCSSPSCKCEINLCKGIAALPRAKEFLLSELHRWWGESKSFWRQWWEQVLKIHTNLVSLELLELMLPVFSVFSHDEGEKGWMSVLLSADDVLHLKSCSSFHRDSSAMGKPHVLGSLRFSN